MTKETSERNALFKPGEIRSELHSAFNNMQDEIQSLRSQLVAAEAKVAALENDLTFVPINDDAKDGKRYIVFGLPESNELVRFTCPGWHVASFDMIDERFCLNGGTWAGPFIDPTHYLPNFDPTPPQTESE